MLSFLGWLFHLFSTFSCRSVETAFCVVLSEDAKIPKHATNGSAKFILVIVIILILVFVHVASAFCNQS